MSLLSSASLPVTVMCFEKWPPSIRLMNIYISDELAQNFNLIVLEKNIEFRANNKSDFYSRITLDLISKIYLVIRT